MKGHPSLVLTHEPPTPEKEAALFALGPKLLPGLAIQGFRLIAQELLELQALCVQVYPAAKVYLHDFHISASRIPLSNKATQDQQTPLDLSDPEALRWLAEKVKTERALTGQSIMLQIWNPSQEPLVVAVALAALVERGQG